MTQQVRAQRPSHPAALALPRMTYEEFLEWDFENPHVEWVDGEVVMMAPVSYEHQDVRGFLFALLKHFIEEHDLGRLLDDPFQMKTGPALPGRAPDVQFISNKNFGRLKKNHLKGPADLVIEIISPGSRGTDRGDKFYEYEKGGVKEYWLIDPERRRAGMRSRASGRRSGARGRRARTRRPFGESLPAQPRSHAAPGDLSLGWRPLARAVSRHASTRTRRGSGAGIPSHSAR